MRLTGKRALITGTATGIGRETALLFAKEGARIVAVDRDEANNIATSEIVRTSGYDCQPVTADISKEDEVVNLFDTVGPIDVLVNNAASVHGDGFLTDLSADAWDNILAVCLRSVFLCSREAIKKMMKQGHGTIVNLSSANA
jgi:3-oxoacyl-[acyl-carrier protein] reductase